MEVRLGTDAGEDRVNRDFGLRWFGVDRTNRFHLNGAPYRIQGGMPGGGPGRSG